MAGATHCPPLPDGVRFTKRGYVKMYNASADEVFAKGMSVIESLGSFVGYELLGQRSLKGLSRAFADNRTGSASHNMFGWETPDTRFEVEMEVHPEGTARSKGSEFVLRFYHPYGTAKPAGNSSSDLTGEKARRVFYHQNTTAFFSEMDSTTNAPAIPSRKISANPTPTFHHESMKTRYRFASRNRRLLLYSSIAVSLFILLLRYLL